MPIKGRGLWKDAGNQALNSGNKKSKWNEACYYGSIERLALSGSFLST
jgi:hypothetical protein